MVKTREVRSAFSEAHTLTYKLLTGGEKPESKKRPTPAFRKYLKKVMETYFQREGIEENKLTLWREWYGKHSKKIGELKPLTVMGVVMGVDKKSAPEVFAPEYNRILDMINDTLTTRFNSLRNKETASHILGDGYVPLHDKDGILSSAIEGMHSGHYRAMPEAKDREHEDTRCAISEFIELMLRGKYSQFMGFGLESEPHRLAGWWSSFMHDSRMEKKHESLLALWIAKKDPKTVQEVEDVFDQGVIDYNKNKKGFLKETVKDLGWKGREKEMYKTLEQLKKLMRTEAK